MLAVVMSNKKNIWWTQVKIITTSRWQKSLLRSGEREQRWNLEWVPVAKFTFQLYQQWKWQHLKYKHKKWFPRTTNFNEQWSKKHSSLNCRQNGNRYSALDTTSSRQICVCLISVDVLLTSSHPTQSRSTSRSVQLAPSLIAHQG